MAHAAPLYYTPPTPYASTAIPYGAPAAPPAGSFGAPAAAPSAAPFGVVPSYAPTATPFGGAPSYSTTAASFGSAPPSYAPTGASFGSVPSYAPTATPFASQTAPTSNPYNVPSYTPTATPSAAPYSSVPAAPTAVPSYAPSYAPPEIPYSAPTAPYASAQFGSILQSADPPSVAYAPSFGPPGGVLPSSLPAQLQVPYEEESPRPYQEVQLIRIPETHPDTEVAASPVAEEQAVEEEPPAEATPLGELFVDPTSPESLAPWLLLLDANALFVIHMVDPQTSYQTPSNPHGKVPLWIDADGSCIWECNAIMRYISLKHKLPPHFYSTDHLDIRMRTDMALDWATTTLFPHIHQVLDPRAYERSDSTDMPTAKLFLDMDFKVLTDFFLKEMPFIGGEVPNIADYVIGMQSLMLFATDYPLFDTVRSYLYNIAENSENWNEVTGTLRDHCAYLQQEHRALEAEAERHQIELRENRRHSREELKEAALEDERRKEEDAEWERRLEGEREQREEEYLRRREEEDQQLRGEWQRLAAQEAARQAALEEAVTNPEVRDEIDRLQGEARRQEADLEARREQFEARRREQQAELEALEAQAQRQQSVYSTAANSAASPARPPQGARKSGSIATSPSRKASSTLPRVASIAKPSPKTAAKAAAKSAARPATAGRKPSPKKPSPKRPSAKRP